MNYRTVARLTASTTCCLALFWSTVAGAIPVQWTLEDVEFEDGGTAYGSFIYDADTSSFSSISIVTTTGGLASGASYSDLLIGGPDDAAFATGPDYTGVPLLQLVFMTSLTNAGGPIPIYDAFAPPGPSSEGTCIDAACVSAGFDRFVTSGGVLGSPLTAVPLPPAVALFGGALATLGWLRKRIARQM